MVERVRGTISVEGNTVNKIMLMDSAVRDEDLAVIAGIELRNLDLSETEVSDRGLAALGPMDALSTLRMGWTNIDGSGLAGLSGRALHTLYLRSCEKFGDAGLRHVSRFLALETLWLDGTAVTDEGLAALQPLKQLKFLKLEGTNVSDRGIVSLGKLASLRSLGVGNTSVTRKGIERLRCLIPNLKPELRL